MKCGHNENKDDPNAGEEYGIMIGKKLRLISNVKVKSMLHGGNWMVL